MSRYIFVAAIGVRPEKESLFNEIYDREHLPAMLTVPGVLGCRRYKLAWQEGEMPQYLAIYELESPEVPHGDAWKAAGAVGVWKSLVRPHLTERRFATYEVL